MPRGAKGLSSVVFRTMLRGRRYIAANHSTYGSGNASATGGASWTGNGLVAAPSPRTTTMSMSVGSGGETAREHYSWGEDIRITYTGTGAYRPDCATDHLNNTHIVFEREMAGDPEIYYTVLDWRDNKLVNDIRITNMTGSSLRPRIALDGAGSAHIVWQDDRSGNWGIYYARLDPDRTVGTILCDTGLKYLSTDLFRAG